MKERLEPIAAVLLSAVFVIFGLNKFLGFIAVSPPADPIAQQYLGAMFNSYLYVVVGLAEIAGAVLLVIPRFRFIGWLILGVIVFNIGAFHIAHDFIGNGIWLLPTVLFVFVGLFQAKHFATLFRRTEYLKKRQIQNSAIAIIAFSMITSSLFAQGDNYVSIKVENSILLEESAEKIWTVISNPENLSLLVPAVIANTESVGKGLYATWLIHLQNEKLITEEMTYFNPIGMELSYVMSKTPMPVKEYRALQQVEKLSDGRSKVTFTAYCNVLPNDKDLIQTNFRNFQETFLNNIENIIQ